MPGRKRIVKASRPVSKPRPESKSYEEIRDFFLADRLTRSGLKYTPPPANQIPPVPNVSESPRRPSTPGPDRERDETDFEVFQSHIGWRNRLHVRNIERARADIRTRRTWTPKFYGSEVKSFEELQTPQHYLLWRATRLGNLQMTLRRQRQEKSSLHIDEAEYILKLHHDPARHPIYLMQFTYALISILEEIYMGTLRAYQGGDYEVQFEVTHPEMSDVGSGIQSSIDPLTESNLNIVIETILDQLLNWVQSEKPNSTMDQMKIMTVVAPRNFAGNGIMAMDDTDKKNKCFTKNNIHGTLFYVDSSRDCFWISIYFGLQYQQFDHLARSSRTNAEMKRLADNFNRTLQEPATTLPKTVRRFFAQHGIDVDNFEPGSLPALHQVHRSFDIQLSIFDESRGHHR